MFLGCELLQSKKHGLVGNYAYRPFNGGTFEIMYLYIPYLII